MRCLRMYVVVLVTFLAFGRAAQAQALSGEWTGSWGLAGVNGPVHALVEVEGRLYVGGTFTTAGSEITPGFAVYDFGEGRWRGGGGVEGAVEAIAVGPDGSVYVGGQFDVAGGEPAENIARYEPDTGEWNPLGEGIDGFSVFALAFGPDGALYAGGSFESAGGEAARNIARWDGTSWSAIGNVGEDSSDGVTSLVFDGDVLYVAGRFSVAGGRLTENVVSYDTATMTWGELGGGVDRAVLPGVDAMAVSEEGVFVGGTFDEAIQPDGSTLAVNNVARWDLEMETWSALGEGTDRLLYTLSFGPDGMLYAAGEWDDGEVDPEPLRRWDGQGWEAVDFGPAYPQSGAFGSALLGAGDRLYVGYLGYFFFEGGNPNSFLYWYEPAIEEWGVLGSSATSGFTDNVSSLAAGSNGTVYAGGVFRFGGTEQIDYVARWDAQAEAWVALGSGADQPVGNLLVHSSGDLYIGGSFSEVYQGDETALAADGVAHWDPQAEQWASLGGGIRSGVGRNLAEANDGMLYVGGSFSEVYQSNGDPLVVEGIARWDPETEVWFSVPGGHGLDGIGALAVDVAGALYASGSYTVDGTNDLRGRVARLDPETEAWETLREWPFSSARELSVIGDPRGSGALYVGTNSEGVWRWAGETWTDLGGPEFVYSLALNGDPEAGGELYAGGVNADASGPFVQRWDSESWSGLGSGLAGFVSPPLVHALAVGEAEAAGKAALWVGGEFIAAGSEPASCIARWETEDFDTDAEEGGTTPATLGLEVYPNPASGPLTVRYALPSSAPVRLAVFDVLGREVALLADGVQAAGTHEAQSAQGGLASGVYVVRLETGSGAVRQVRTQRVTVVR